MSAMRGRPMYSDVLLVDGPLAGLRAYVPAEPKIEVPSTPGRVLRYVLRSSKRRVATYGYAGDHPYTRQAR